MENKILADNPIFEGSGTTQPRKVEDIERRNRPDDLALNGGKARVDVVPEKDPVSPEVREYVKTHGLQFDKQYIFTSQGVAVVDEVPESYSGISYYFGNDGLYIENYADGTAVDEIFISSSAIIISDADGHSVNLSVNGVGKLDFAELTHSLDELGPTLKQLVEDAIADGGVNGVPCTQEQWNTIKALFDKSLYLNYNGYSLLKCVMNETGTYLFGYLGNAYGESLEFYFEEADNLLYVKHTEV